MRFYVRNTKSRGPAGQILHPRWQGLWEKYSSRNSAFRVGWEVSRLKHEIPWDWIGRKKPEHYASGPKEG